MNNSKEQTALSNVRKLVVIYAVVGVILLATMATVALLHGSVSTFMWVRAGILLAAAVPLYRWTADARRGLVASFDRLRKVSLILPIAIVAVDLVPGICPGWYASLQGVSALALVAVAILTRVGALRGARTSAN
ncbi:MAG TPA: hypothetical protein VGF80_09000 [Galbitalea sp.]|jgi:hypothetical protein